MLTVLHNRWMSYTAGSGFGLGFTGNNGFNESGAYDINPNASGTVAATLFPYTTLFRSRTGMTLPASVPASAALVQQTGVEGGPAASTAVSFSSSVTAGDLVVVAVGTWSNPSVSSFTVTDNKGNTYTQAAFINNGGRRSV